MDKKEITTFTCHSCKHEFTWDRGNDIRGNIYQCENCDKYICFSCLFENEHNVGEMAEVLCLDCLRGRRIA
ncbi:hypothetical protein SAMN05446037_1006147 [Anaerovirgula multivorans]|uniref:Uncharacterized protein n=1 Tax=Anaerovirgula multivorans TaxID=312168 RepID=A0A239CV03_9FIRM|nr:hypothetical protein [Anaerovirgula multivorans]SNS23491.1 hypothetical protein SAMN05446037_1006147 [Anaerovirgula multivorans]